MGSAGGPESRSEGKAKANTRDRRGSIEDEVHVATKMISGPLNDER